MTERQRRESRALVTAHGSITFPAFLPDATRGVVRGTDSRDMEECQVPALMMSTFHLMRGPGGGVIAASGGLHRFCAWPRPIMTDSGGFQVFSMIRQNAKYGSFTDRGVLFRPDSGRKKLLLTPEKSIQTQFRCGADVLVCLDDCTHPEDPIEAQRDSVERTVRWARKCRDGFDRILQTKSWDTGRPPLLFAVVQGGRFEALRRECADRLLEIGFDGYGFGGWPIDNEGDLLYDSLAYTRGLIPAEYPMHALGIGHPLSIARLCSAGYDLFDSSLPTRDARHGRLYIVRESEIKSGAEEGAFYSRLYVQDDRHIRSRSPIDPSCDCFCCRRYELAYLHHLFKVDDTLFQRLATIHNVRTMMRLMAALQQISSRPPEAQDG